MLVCINSVWLISVVTHGCPVQESRLIVVKFSELQCTLMVMNKSELCVCPLTVCEGSNTVTIILCYCFVNYALNKCRVSVRKLASCS